MIELLKCNSLEELFEPLLGLKIEDYEYNELCQKAKYIKDFKEDWNHLKGIINRIYDSLLKSEKLKAKSQRQSEKGV